MYTFNTSIMKDDEFNIGPHARNLIYDAIQTAKNIAMETGLKCTVREAHKIVAICGRSKVDWHNDHLKDIWQQIEDCRNMELTEKANTEQEWKGYTCTNLCSSVEHSQECEDARIAANEQIEMARFSYRNY
jgi:hypothetical protein